MHATMRPVVGRRLRSSCIRESVVGVGALRAQFETELDGIGESFRYAAS